FALSGSDQNPDLTGKDLRLLAQRVLPGAVGPVAAFAQQSPEFVWGSSPEELARGMNALTGSRRIDPEELARLVALRDAQVASGLGKDPQVARSEERRVGKEGRAGWGEGGWKEEGAGGAWVGV